MFKNTYQIFPQAVVRYNLNREFTETENNFFKNSINLKEKIFHSDFISNDKFILEKTELQGIKRFCEKSLEDYFSRIYSPADNVNVKPYITQSWINFMNPGTTHVPHTHPNSIISGCFYIDVDSNSDSIDFIKFDYKQFAFSTKETNDFNTTVVSLKVNRLDLILFPSSIYHTVPKTENKNIRISLAFNSFLKGEFGNADRQLNYLKL